MAEFQEVMKQKNRLCKRFFGQCASCPLIQFTTCLNPESDALPAYEAVIMSWAKENPEPKYPTWIEWQQKMFPNATNAICPKEYMSKEEAHCNGSTCYDCRRQRIPDEIAVKLGLKKEVIE